MGSSSYRSQASYWTQALCELGDLISMRPQEADVHALGEDLARLAAIVRLANIVVLAVAMAVVPLRLLPAAGARPAISHWPTGHRDLVLVDHTGQEAWEMATRTAVARWNSAGADVHLTWETGDGSCEEDGDRIAFCLVGVSELKGFVEYEGLTTPQVTNEGHASGARIDACSDCGLDNLGREIVATHEIGHALGLAHNRRFGSVMFPSGGSGELDTQDRTDLRRLYAHQD